MSELHIGEKIREARKAKGLSQGDLASEIGIKQSSVSDIESGRITPRDSTVLAISKALDDDLGQRWLTVRLSTPNPQESNIDTLLKPILRKIERSEAWLYILVAKLGEISPTFRSMLRDGMFESISEAVLSVISRENEENVVIKPLSSKDVMLAPVIAHIGPDIDKEEQGREMLISDEAINEMGKGSKPRKRKTG